MSERDEVPISLHCRYLSEQPLGSGPPDEEEAVQLNAEFDLVSGRSPEQPKSTPLKSKVVTIELYMCGNLQHSHIKGKV